MLLLLGGAAPALAVTASPPAAAAAPAPAPAPAPSAEPTPPPVEPPVEPPPPAPELRESPSADVRWFYRFYDIDNGLFTAVMQGADLSAYPVFFGALPAVWMADLNDDPDEVTNALRFTAAELGAFLTMYVMKRTWPKPRPFVALPDVIPRDRPRSAVVDPTSFPSGHTMVAFNQAASWSLANPRWYVIAPAALWAASVGLSRMWLGMHYPVDVLTGAAIGTALAVAAYLLIPEDGDADGAQAPPPGISFALRF